MGTPDLDNHHQSFWQLIAPFYHVWLLA